MLIPPSVRKYFWDIDTKYAQPKRHPDYYIKRILELGDGKAFRWLGTVFGENTIKRVAKNARLSPKSKNYWKLNL